MKWLSVAAAIAAAFYLGTKSGRKPEPPSQEPPQGIRADFERLSQEELKDYQDLKEKRLKYEAANKVLAKVMQIFIADLGLKSIKQNECKVTTEFIAPNTQPQPPTTPPPPPAQPEAPEKTESTNRANFESIKRGKRPPRPGYSESGRRLAFPTDKAKNAVNALYQAVLWRQPDTGGGEAATTKFSEDGWREYMDNARSMVRSQEFLKEIEPNHSSAEIINHMYAVYMGRCSFPNEMNTHIRTLSSDGPGAIIASIISKARQNHTDQILAGGFSPSSCAN